MRTTGKVKSFDPIKGFGLVLTEEGTTVLLEQHALAAAGHATIAEGVAIVIDIALESRGLVVTRVHSVAEPPRPDGENPADLPAGAMRGTCKWFSRPKGYGFITLAGGGEDVFVQMDTLRKAGITELRQGQSIVFHAARGIKGLTVTRVVAA